VIALWSAHVHTNIEVCDHVWLQKEAAEDFLEKYSSDDETETLTINDFVNGFADLRMKMRLLKLNLDVDDVLEQVRVNTCTYIFVLLVCVSAPKPFRIEMRSLAILCTCLCTHTAWSKGDG
jgi:hypothetical protein